jgi:hypothetical protein
MGHGLEFKRRVEPLNSNTKQAFQGIHSGVNKFTTTFTTPVLLGLSRATRQILGSKVALFATLFSFEKGH